MNNFYTVFFLNKDKSVHNVWNLSYGENKIINHDHEKFSLKWFCIILMARSLGVNKHDRCWIRKARIWSSVREKIGHAKWDE